jgi:hypothetical protein
MDRYLQTWDKSIYDKNMIAMKAAVESCRRLLLSRSYTQRSFGLDVEKRTDLKWKRLFSPHRTIYKTITNVRGTNVISHRLRPVPINR